MARKYDLISELYRRTAHAVVSDVQNWQAFLRCACRNYRLRFDEQLLIYAQRPDTTAVLEIERWNDKFGRWVNRGAKGIAVFEDADRSRQRLTHYFDISDTHASRYSRPVPIWEMKPEYTDDVIESLENTFGELENRESLADAVLSAAKNAVEDNIPDYLGDLMYAADDSFLYGLSEDMITAMYKKAVTNSVAYVMMTRLGIDTEPFFEAEDFSVITNFNTPEALNALGIASSDIAEMGLGEISVPSLPLKGKIASLRTERNRNTIRLKIKAKGALKMNELTYTMQGDYNLPDLTMPKQPEVTLGRYAQMRRKFLREHHKIRYYNLLTSCTLTQHLAETEQTAMKLEETLMKQMTAQEGLTESLKAADMMKWVQGMNNLRNRVQEIVKAEIIFA